MADIENTFVRMVIQDDVPIDFLVNSPSMKKLFELYPSYPKTVEDGWEVIRRAYQRLTLDVIAFVDKEKHLSHKFSLCIADVWHYRNFPPLYEITLHNEGQWHVLGLVPAQLLENDHLYDFRECLKQKLCDFNLSFSDIVSITYDGSERIENMIEDLPFVKQKCYAQALHDIVIRTCYKPKKLPDEENVVFTSYLTEFDVDNINYETEHPEQGSTSGIHKAIRWRNRHEKVIKEFELIPYFAENISKVREIIRFFYTDIDRVNVLQKHLTRRRGNENSVIHLYLDRPDYWQTCLMMVKQFHRLHSFILRALVEIDDPIQIAKFKEINLENLEEFSHTLGLINLTIDKLSNNEANLLQSDSLFELLRRHLKFSISDVIREGIRHKLITHRNQPCLTLMHLLKKGPNDLGEFDFTGSSKGEVFTFSASLMQRLFVPEEVDNEENFNRAYDSASINDEFTLFGATKLLTLELTKLFRTVSLIRPAHSRRPWRALSVHEKQLRFESVFPVRGVTYANMDVFVFLKHQLGVLQQPLDY